MVSGQQVLAAAALLSLGGAVPTKQQVERRAARMAFSVREEYNPAYVPVKRDPVELYRRALEKANPALRRRDLKPTVADEDATHRKNTTDSSSGSGKAGSVQINSQFQAPVSVGDQEFLITFDTGSSDFWLLGDSLSSSGGKHTYYKPGSTAKQVKGATFDIHYADGSSASGPVWTDDVAIGTVKVSDMEIGDASQAASAFTGGSSDGLIGLGPGNPTVKPGPAKTFMDTFAAQGGKKFFAVDLQPNGPGTYDFGMTDKSKYTGDIAYQSADIGSGYWLITTDDGIKTIVDTGTTVTVLPHDVASKYWSGVKSAKSSVPAGHDTETIWTFDCSESLPPFPLKVGGKTINVPGSAINMGPSGSGNQCTGGLQVNTAFSSWSIIGDMFIRGMYVVYDFGTDGGKSQVGFAEKSSASKTTGSSSPSGTSGASAAETSEPSACGGVPHRSVTPVPKNY